ncbi:MAG: M48 family metallopeptidase [Trichodesmium sp. ALOHA_ZT_67]|nr:M48 family metallopeptidase [Trichodesmium sp. ALOHA_ZT_67]MDE5072805.1 M48 family metallopeptidase [Trichodesmium sp. St5_bin8]MDE5090824.1 M48 family metallopeptidase [Trichodesmium sp. St18_bin3_1_1]MDE5095802.1 M48 family metallopeptidase [Trichodesmium sp. St11_bin5]MDE5102368.1 M48 family metallopeptidase [Trichodesmium sp. St19_bin2]MDT9341865.1 M48 family metallopeptidase [Trichodesmium erythraeum 21-75]
MALTKTQLIGLKANHFRHPLDLEATNALKQLPGIDLLVRQLLSPLGEQFFYMENIASSVLVSEAQLPNLHKTLLDACQALDIEPPQLYIRQNPVPNAYTFAMRGKQPFIVVHTSLIELLNLEEIQAVLGHELGHLKCEHGVYLTLGNLIVLAAGQISTWGGIIAQSLQSKILEWLRCAEFSCDRAALLATQNSQVVVSALMKLAGGSPTISPQLNVDAFLAQARAYNELSNTEVGEVLKEVQTAQLTHPLPVLRAKEIDMWASSKKYQDILQTLAKDVYNNQRIKGGWRNW